METQNQLSFESQFNAKRNSNSGGRRPTPKWVIRFLSVLALVVILGAIKRQSIEAWVTGPLKTPSEEVELDVASLPASLSDVLSQFGKQAIVTQDDSHWVNHEMGLNVTEYRLERHDRLSDVLETMGFDASATLPLMASIRKVYSPRRFLSTHFIRVKGNGKQVVFFEYEIDQNQLLQVEWANGAYHSKIEKVAYETSLVKYDGNVTNNLYDTGRTMKVTPQVMTNFAEIFAYDVDFSRELRTGDRVSLIVEQQFKKGQFVRFGKVVAAKFTNQNRPYYGFYYDSGRKVGYYNESGHSLEKMFLRSPIPYSRVTSKFNKRRFHPVLKMFRAHNGVDYAALVGTPIHAVGDGKVIYQGWKGGSGRFVKLQHTSTYSSSYSHLSRFNSRLRMGSRVKQGDIIGYVGMTGLATGPHLHFAFYQNGKYVDPLKLKFTSREPLTVFERKEFIPKIKKYRDTLELLDSPKVISLAELSNR